jgi:hypothetical protein
VGFYDVLEGEHAGGLGPVDAGFGPGDQLSKRDGAERNVLGAEHEAGEEAQLHPRRQVGEEVERVDGLVAAQKAHLAHPAVWLRAAQRVAQHRVADQIQNRVDARGVPGPHLVSQLAMVDQDVGGADPAQQRRGTGCGWWPGPLPRARPRC